MHFLNINLLIIVTLFSASLTFSQNPKKHSLDPSKQISEYSFSIWKPDNHFSQNQISAIIQAENGLLLAGTSDGLFKFDGTNFFNIDLGIEKINQNVVVNSLLRTKNNLIWVGTNYGIVLLKNLKPVKYEKVEGITDCDILSICQTDDSTVWFGTNGSGLIKYSNNKFSFFDNPDYLQNLPIPCLSVDSKKNLWAATSGSGILKIGENTITRFTDKNGLSGNYVSSIFIDNSDTVYIGYQTGNLNIMYNDKLIIDKSITHNYSATQLYKDSRNTLWMGTRGRGLIRILNGELSSFSYADGLPNNGILTIFEDNDGNLWVGTKASYLIQFRNTFIKIMSTNDGLISTHVRSICEGKNGVIWVAATNNINKIEKNKTSVFNSKHGLPNSTIRCLYEDKNGTLLVGTNDKGIYKLENNRFIPYKKEIKGFINAFLETKDNSLYIGNGGNIFKIKGDNVSEIPYNSKNNVIIRTMLQDKKGNLWTGGNNGINIYSDNGKYSSIEYFDTLSNIVVFSLHEDENETIWIGTYGNGLFRYKDGKITAFSRKEGLLDNHIYDIFEDKNSNLWMSTNFGVFGIKREYLDNYAEGKINDIPQSSYILLTELLGIECNGGSQPAGCLTKSGILLFPSVVGIVQINPGAITIDEKPFKPIIADISIDNISQDLSSPIVLSKNAERVEFHFTSPIYQFLENIQFKYKLEPFDEDWIDAGSQKAAYYTNLPPRKYEFKVIASNALALWSDEYASIILYKEAHIYETIWFYIVIAAFILLIIYFYFKLRLQHLTKQKKQLESEINQRLAFEETLTISEKRYKSLFENSPLCILELDYSELAEFLNELTKKNSNADLPTFFIKNSNILESCYNKIKIIDINEEAKSFLHAENIPLEKCSGLTFFKVTADAKFINHIMSIVNHKFQHEQEMTIRLHNNEEREVIASTSSHDNDFKRVLLSLVDITARKKAEEEIFRREKIKSLGLLAGGIAHDFNNLLTTILGNISLSKLLVKKVTDGKVNQSLESAEKAAVKAKDLTLQLLTFSKGGNPIKKQIDLNDIIKDSANFMMHGSKNKLEIIIPDDIWKVEVDHAQISQVIQNLVINADQACEKPATITLSCQNVIIDERNNSDIDIKNGEYVRVSVKDEGTGISEELKAKIFDPYFTTKTTGNGIGLATCFTIIKKHQGDLKVISEVNKGSEFYFYLPAYL